LVPSLFGNESQIKQLFYLFGTRFILTGLLVQIGESIDQQFREIERKHQYGCFNRQSESNQIRKTDVANRRFIMYKANSQEGGRRLAKKRALSFNYEDFHFGFVGPTRTVSVDAPEPK
jgi:hypothetical protein